MSQGITNFAVGATAPVLIVTLVPAVPYPRTLILLGVAGRWFPTPRSSSPIHVSDGSIAAPPPTSSGFTERSTAFDRDDSSRAGALALALFILVTAALEWMSYPSPLS